MLQIEKRTPHIRCHRQPRRFQPFQRRVAPGGGRLHPATRRESIEDMPACIQSDDVTVVKLRADERIVFAIEFVAGERFHARTRLAPVEDQLLVFDLDIDFARFDFRPVHVGVGEALIQIGMAR